MRIRSVTQSGAPSSSTLGAPVKSHLFGGNLHFITFFNVQLLKPPNLGNLLCLLTGQRDLERNEKLPRAQVLSVHIIEQRRHWPAIRRILRG